MKYITALLACALLSGCALFDWNQDGKFDPIAYLAGADISVVWVGEDGTAYQMALDELGMKIAGEYIQAKTGYRFELAPLHDGTYGIEITDPNGYQVWIVPK